MYIRLINSTLRENEYLFHLNDQQKVYFTNKLKYSDCLLVVLTYGNHGYTNKYICMAKLSAISCKMIYGDSSELKKKLCKEVLIHCTVCLI